VSYATMDHAEWMQRNNEATLRNIATRKAKPPASKFLPPEKLTPFQKKVIDIIGMVGGGIYNAPISPDRIEWTYGFNGVSVVWQREMGTFDFSQLTMLVFLCHEARIRCSVESAMKHLRLSFWQRKAEGDMAVRHPNLDEAVKAFREYLPADHRVVYRETTET